jgi:hypothetical protein
LGLGVGGAGGGCCEEGEDAEKKESAHVAW